MGALTACQRAPRWWAAIEIGLLERIAQFGRLVAEPADLAQLRECAPFIAWAGAADVVAARAIVEAIGVGLARFFS
ncbi:MAG: hypothetical protein LH467_07800 [Gemmatimonadaceae bacterium]|nr:hypothetical protein [Gemmatimonadaceae bacterium]